VTACRITKSVGVDYGHRVPGHDGQCRHPHGHRGTFEMVVEGPVPESGMIVDFGWMKRALMTAAHDRFDHRMVLHRADPFADLLIEAGRLVLPDEGFRVALLDRPPTAENLAAEVFRSLAPFIPEGCRLVEVRVWETPTSCAIYQGGGS
jgi:6-pyruvoyltetrahydropterin/6-carboxytetrahydropterin synthase